MKRPNSVFTGNITYRKLSIKDPLRTSIKPDESLISRVEYRLVLLKGSVTSSTFYEIGSGMEVKKEFSYIKVANGQGVYEWIDRDSNKIETLDEFEIAAFQYNANYIKVYTPTNAYIKTFSNMFNEVLYIKPAAFWKNEEGIKKFIARFSNQAAYRVDRKNTSRNLGRANPFLSETDDSTLVTLNSSFRNILSFNKNDSRFGVDLKYQEIRNKSLLINGFDSRTQLLKSAYIRWNLSKQYTLNFLAARGSKTSASELFSAKDYKIEYSEFEPGLAFQPNSKFRINAYYNYKDKENRLMKLLTDTIGGISGGERALHNKMGAEMKQNSVAKGSLLFKVDYINITFKKQDGSKAVQNTSLGFEMMEGLQTGSNFTWSASYQRNLSGHMQLSVTYDGRKSEETPAAHRGSVQVRAFF